MALVKLNPVQTLAAYAQTELAESIRASIERLHPRLHQLPEFNKDKGDLPIALAGGGPSIKNHLDELRQFGTVMAAGSSHDYLAANGIKCRYSILLDAHSTVTASYIQQPNPETTYLVATHCPESVFKALDGYPIAMWHCIMDSTLDYLGEVEPGFQGLSGGCTSGLRALYMAAVLGYKNMHLFGYDSCLPDTGESHAYPLQSEEIEQEGIAADKIYEIKFGIGGPESRGYRCLGYQLAQAQNFETIIANHHRLFDLTFHGDGLLSDIYGTLMANKDKLVKEESIDGLRAAS